MRSYAALLCDEHHVYTPTPRNACLCAFCFHRQFCPYWGEKWSVITVPVYCSYNFHSRLFKHFSLWTMNCTVSGTITAGWISCQSRLHGMGRPTCVFLFPQARKAVWSIFFSSQCCKNVFMYYIMDYGCMDFR